MIINRTRCKIVVSFIQHTSRYRCALAMLTTFVTRVCSHRIASAAHRVGYESRVSVCVKKKVAHVFQHGQCKLIDWFYWEALI